MTLEQKAEKVIRKLLELTQDKKIQWNRTTETRFLTRGTDDVVPVAYSTKYKDHRFVIYEARYQTCDADERVYWDDRVCLDMIDFDGNLIWRLPRNVRTRDLFSSVTVRAGNVEEALDDLLNDD